MGSLISKLTGRTRSKVKNLSDEDILDLKRKWFEKYRQEDYINDFTSTYACDKDTDINAEYMSSELR